MEQEVDRLKDKLSRSHKKSSTRLSDVPSHTTDSETVVSDDTPVGPHGSDVCEICEQPGHDILTCDVLKGNAPAPSRPQSSASSLFCEDCEGYGHTAADCPHSMDVF